MYRRRGHSLEKLKLGVDAMDQSASEVMRSHPDEKVMGWWDPR